MRIVTLDDYQRVATAMADRTELQEAEVIAVDHPISDHAALVDRLTGADVVVAMREPTAFPADLLAALPDLRLPVTTGMDNRAIDLHAAKAQGVVVCGAPGSGYGASERAFGLLLGLARRIPDETQRFRTSDPRWQMGVWARQGSMCSTSNGCPLTTPCAVCPMLWPHRISATSPRQPNSDSSGARSR